MPVWMTEKECGSCILNIGPDSLLPHEGEILIRTMAVVVEVDIEEGQVFFDISDHFCKEGL